MPRLVRILLVVLWFSASISGSAAVAAESIAVNAAVRYQTMTGWEALARSWEIDKVNNRYDPSWRTHAPAIADRMANELGINRIAMVLNSGWANPNDYWTRFVNGQLSYTQWGALWYHTVDPNSHQFSEFDFYAETVVVPMKNALQARGEKLHVNMIFGDGDKSAGTTFFFAKNPAAYAAFVLAYVDRLKTKYGVVLDSYTIINEPDNTATWRGAEIGRALVAVRNRLDAAGYTNVELIAPSVASPGNAIPYLTAIAAVPGALSALDVASYHRYGSSDIGAIQSWAAQRGKDTAMSELFTANIDTVLDDLLVGQVSSWQKWSVGGKAGGSLNGYYVADLSNPSAPVYNFAPNAAPMALVFRYVRHGAARVDATSPTMRTVAFVNPDGSYVVHAKRAVGAGNGPVTISGLRPGTYGVRSIAAGTTQASNQPDVTAADDGTVTVTLGEGYTTLYGKAAAAAPSTQVTLVEYHHAAWDHYFLTGNPVEIAQLDNGTFAGWARTGYQFKAYDAAAANGSSVCRFFSTSFAPRSSHFYTASPTECALVAGNADWSMEGVVFSLPTPDPDGTCRPGTRPVYRLYNNGLGGTPNHRYTIDPAVRLQMIERGWTPEELAPAVPGMCAVD